MTIAISRDTIEPSAEPGIERVDQGRMHLLVGVAAYAILLSAVCLPQSFVSYPTMAFDWIQECLLEGAELSLQYYLGLTGF